MVKDPIVEEIHRVRDAQAKRFGYDLNRICEALERRRETLRQQGWKFAKPPRRRAARKLAA